MIVTACGAWYFKYLPTYARTSLAAIFTEVEDPRFVRILLTFLETSRNDSVDMYYITRALQRHIPLLRQEHWENLASYERYTLLGLLVTSSVERDLMLKILHALTQDGPPDALSPVLALASQLHRSWDQTGRQDPELKQALENCLQFLHWQAEQYRQNTALSRQAQTLLRASDAVGYAPETLLRPAESVPSSTPKEELLRPPS